MMWPHATVQYGNQVPHACMAFTLTACILSLRSDSATPRKQSRSFGSVASSAFRSSILWGTCKSCTVGCALSVQVLGLRIDCGGRNNDTAPCGEASGRTWKQSLVSPAHGAKCATQVVSSGRRDAAAGKSATEAAAALRGRVHTCRDSRWGASAANMENGRQRVWHHRVLACAWHQQMGRTPH